MIVADRLVRRYGDLVAVDNVAFTIKTGEIVGLLGKNGAGKTTIMKMMTGFLEPDAGSVSFDGVDMHGVDRDQVLSLKQKLGYLAENLPLYTDMSVVDYLDFTAQMHGLGDLDRPSAVRDAISETDLHDKVFERISMLSRGYRQRVGVAQAILHRPEFLVLDEPTNGLDPSQVRHMRGLIRRISSHATVVLSTHIMQEVNAVCDRVLILKNGQLVLDEYLQALKYSSRLLLKTNATPAAVNAALVDIDGLSAALLLGSLDDTNELALPLSSSDEALDTSKQEQPQANRGSAVETQALAAEVVRSLVGHDISVFGLVPEQRDLESLFLDDEGQERAGQNGNSQELAQQESADVK
ncbi:MAG: ABC transporter ATP-binding protein [Pseudomonadales bacterium]|nr:ABC transporter ATP-binding protein [Pseudomonadales bacterium]